MGTGRWSRIEELFHQAADLAPAERPAFLDRVCEDDEELRRELESLLAADTPEDRRFQAAVDRAVEQFPATSDEGGDPIGKRIGRYSITGLIGKGGMGAVYRAVREDDFRMQVAIKLLKRGTDTEAALSRFRVERQILAGLQHPNIAHLIDGGATETGLPYFVMEYVEGTPLLESAAPLTVRQRLELFGAVCSAVQYAHEKLIVHRDIKPANILVTPAGIPKLLDFGIAKLLDPTAAGATTFTGARLMTPDYASPEQVRGEPVTAATDIYSLGAVLYELLTGKRAHHVKRYSPGEIEKEICTREPPRPSTVVKELDADLDNIVLMALRKEPERRYASVEELSEDLDRFVQDLPVHARKESLPYRGRKFLKRNRALVTAAAVTAIIVLALVAGLSRFAASTVRTDPVKARRPVSNGTTPQRWNDLKFEKIATLGDPAPGGGSFTKDFEPWGLNSRGDLAFVSDVSIARLGVFLLRRGGGSAVQLARSGQPAPGGGTFERDIDGASISDSGDVAFVFGLKELNPPELKGFPKEGLFRYSHADRKLNAVVIPGVTLAPGFGVFLSTGMHPTLNNSGDIVFPGVVRTAAGVSRSQDVGAGIFVIDHSGQVTKVVAPGDPAPGGGKFDFAQNPWINDRGDVAFGAHVAGEECISGTRDGCAESVYFKAAANGIVESIAHQGEQGPLAIMYRYAWGPVLNNRGDIVFIGELTPRPGLRAARGIFLYSRGLTTPIAFPGDIMPDGRKIVTVNPAYLIGNYSLNNRGDVSFNASLENGESAFYVYSQGLLHLAAGTGTVIPGVGTISSVANLLLVNGGTLNDSGQIFFWATLTDGRGVLLLATPPPIGADSKQ